MSIESVGEFVNELETYDEWQRVSFGYKNGRPCLFIHNEIDRSDVSGHIFLPEYNRT